MRLVICLGFARAKDRQEKYVLMPSYNAPLGYEPGFLLPPGGQLRVEPDGRNYLQNTLGVPGMLGSDALQFRIPDDLHVNDVADWFMTRQGRQTTITDKVERQLSPGSHIISSMRHAGYLVHHSQPPGRQHRHFQTDPRLTYLVEIFDATLGGSPTGWPGLRPQFATSKEIKQLRLRVGGPGSKINEITKLVIDA